MSLSPSSTVASASLPLQQTASTSKQQYHRFVAGAFVVDFLAVTMALLLAHWLRFETALVEFGTPSDSPIRVLNYTGHIILGVVLMMTILTNFRLYSRENLLSYTNTLRVIFKSAFVWILAYLTLTLVLKFDPPISRVFCALGLVLMLFLLPLWRGILWRVVSQ